MSRAVAIALVCELAAAAAAAEPPPVQPAPIAPGFYMPVVDDEVVLASGAVATLGDGPARLAAHPGPQLVLRRPLAKSTPYVVSSWRGMGVRLFSLRGPVCEAKVTGFELVGRVAGPGKDPKVLWPQATRVLVAKLDAKPGACRGAVFARAAEAPSPELTAPAPVQDQALAEASGPDVGTPRTARLGERLFATWRDGDCAPLKIFERDPKTGLQLVSEPRLGLGRHIAAVVDLDGDLLPELLLEGGGVARRPKGGVYTVVDAGAAANRCPR